MHVVDLESKTVLASAFMYMYSQRTSRVELLAFKLTKTNCADEGTQRNVLRWSHD